MIFSLKKVQFFETLLKDFFQKAGRAELPWRKKGVTAYEVWVSEIMLQQTQVARVIPYYTRFLKKFPTVQSLAKASWEEFLPYYEGLGYYARGRNMLQSAQAVVTKYKGVFPKKKEGLLLLPGVGDYTASAILSFAYKKNTLAWDTNLKRVVGRFFYGSKNHPLETEKLEKLFTVPAFKLNAALMDFGSSVCTAKPKCANCPLQNLCIYFKNNGEQEKAAPKIKKTFPTRDAAVLLFIHQNHRKYYSSQKASFVPFSLSQRYNTRAAIKDFFLKKWGLRLAVRPPHKKIFKNGAPFLLINAQILAGKPPFSTFPKEVVTGYTKDNLK